MIQMNATTTLVAPTTSDEIPIDWNKLPIFQSTANYSVAKLEALAEYFGLNESSSRTALEAQTRDRMQKIIVLFLYVNILYINNIQANMDPDTRRALGYTLKDLVISCAFNQIPCDYDKWFWRL